MAATILASLLALVSMVWQHTASVAVTTTVQSMGYGTIKSDIGAAAMALGWLGFGGIVIVAIAVLVMVLIIDWLHDLALEV